MNFWNEKRVRLANPQAKLYNFYDGWHSKGIKITHTAFEDGNIAIIAAHDAKRTVSLSIGEPIIYEKNIAVIITTALTVERANPVSARYPSITNGSNAHRNILDTPSLFNKMSKTEKYGI